MVGDKTFSASEVGFLFDSNPRPFFADGIARIKRRIKRLLGKC